MDRRRSYVDVMERVLAASSLPIGPGTRSRVCNFTIGRLRSTVSLTVLDHIRGDSVSKNP